MFREGRKAGTAIRPVFFFINALTMWFGVLM